MKSMLELGPNNSVKSLKMLSKSRLSTGVDEEKVKARAMHLVSHQSLHKEWTKVHAASVKFTGVEESNYKHMDYQLYVACSMIKTVGLRGIVVAKFIAGQGKTFIVLLIAQVHVKLRRKVVIVVLNDDLREQYEADLQKYFDFNDAVDVITAENLSYDCAADAVYIVDEVDRIAKHHAVSFRKFGERMVPTGLISLSKAKEVYMLSATYGKYE